MSVDPHLSAYPNFLRSSVRDNWDEIHSQHDLFNPNASNFLRIRVNLGLQHYNDFQPDSYIGDNITLMQLFRTLFREHLNQQSVIVNIAPVLLLHVDDDINNNNNNNNNNKSTKI